MRVPLWIIVDRDSRKSPLLVILLNNGLGGLIMQCSIIPSEILYLADVLFHAYQPSQYRRL